MSLLSQFKRGAWILLALIFSGVGVNAHAAQPFEWQTGLQPAASPTMERITSLYDNVTLVVILIAVFVLVLLVYVMMRFNARSNPTPSTTTHNTMLEIIWTAIPVIIVSIIAVPSLKLVYYADRTVDAEMTLKIVGHQWYWSYAYPDHGSFEFDSNLQGEEELNGEPRLLAVDNKVVLPTGTNIRLIMTSDDVIHAWAVPALGIKLDTVPGRLNETWVRAEQEGTYYGQCSELCGVNHGFMPVAVKFVSKDEFSKWVAFAQEEYALRDDPGASARSLAQLNKAISEKKF